MKQRIMNRVNALSEAMLLHYAAPNENLIVEVLQLNAANLDQVSDSDLGKYIIVLGQYLVMLQHNENMKNIEYILTSKTFEHEVNKAGSSAEGKTAKERRAQLIQNSEELSAMQEELLVAEAEKTLLTNMGKAIEGLLNALKKEKSGRHGEHYGS